MRFLVLGSGGREHAIGWKLVQEGHEVVSAPGNPGLAELGEVYDVALNNRMELLELAKRIEPDLVVIGPEDPLIAGLANMFRENGFATFGPGTDAARLEGSKAFSKDMMKRAGVPTAEYQSFSDPIQAKEYAAARFDAGAQVAVKASGAALGKGVVVCSELEEANQAISEMLEAGSFGQAGKTVVIEDRLFGREFSLLTLVSGDSIHSLPVAQDHKRIFDGDEGPNTGGMGTYSPVSAVSEQLVQQTEEEVVRPILSSLAEIDIPYQGVLFSGLMMEGVQVKCLEYNVRFGDPEIQTVVRRLGSGLGDALLAVGKGERIPEIPVLDNASLTLVLASGGYPGDYEKGKPIEIGELPEGVEVFHAGTRIVNDQLVTNGGRVLGVSSVGKTLDEARKVAYQAAKVIHWEGMQYRSDIGAN
ncbi:MAG: phosphoribosylamine--glycine ligase [Fimbriimonadaceae bacterium]